MARKRPQIPSTAALGFQAGIGVVGLLAIFLFGIPVQYDGLSFGSVVLWGVAGSVATYVVIMMLTWLPGRLRDSLESQLEQLHRFACEYSWSVLVAWQSSQESVKNCCSAGRSRVGWPNTPTMRLR
nr:hypothetical protein [Marinobacter sp. DS40M8]